jgi:methionyl-tRNA formyltransferase
LSSWEGDYIISYLSRWIVPQTLLERVKSSAINFHPASPDYLGVGCNNFALYNEEEFFGVTCHFMLPNVDSGKIIATKKFPIFGTDNVSTLLAKTYDHQLELFYVIMNKILNGEGLNPSGEKWGRGPYTRKELNKLPRIMPEMEEHEIKRRIRATEFGKWKPYLKIGDFIFEYKAEK